MLEAQNTCSACAVETRGLADEVCDAPGLENSALIGLSRTDLIAVGLDELRPRLPDGLLCTGDSTAAGRSAFFGVLAAGLSIPNSLSRFPLDLPTWSAPEFLA